MSSFPKIIQIETSLVCNSHCVFCPHNDMERSPQYMEDWVWKKIVDESRGQGVTYRPFMINEPFLESRMPEIISYIKKDTTAKVELNSNGNFSVKTDLEAIIKAGVDVVHFSIDGLTEETFKRSGRGGKLPKIMENVKRFIEERNRQKSDCFVEIRMIDIEVNKHEQEDFVKYWKQYADNACVTKLYNWPWCGQETFYKAPCPKIKDEMFFMSDGRATLCCWDAMARTIIGDVKERSVTDIWEGEPMKTYKEHLNKGERGEIKLCSRCDAYQGYDFSNWSGY